MEANRVGIGDLRFYVPRNEISLAELVAHRVAETPSLKKHLERALNTTGQRSMRFPEPHEDAATMAAAASRELLAASPEAKTRGLRWLVTGTETGLDHSKPLASYVQGMLDKAGFAIPHNLATFQVQHACAGGALGLLSVAGMLALARDPSETGLVASSDVSRYSLGTTAEITQGAGAAAMLVERDPRLLELDPGSAGFSSHDVDDFFRPLGSTTAKVKGGYSMECYLQGLDEAFDDHARRLAVPRGELLAGIDAVVLHTPFRNMPEIAMKRLLGKELGLDEAAATAWLDERGFFKSVDIIADIGNSYSASLFIFLASSLRVLRARHGEAIVGKRVLIGSYGSGNVMAVFTATVAPGAGAVIDSWDIDGAMAGGRRATIEDYDLWTSGYENPDLEEMSCGDPGCFRLLDVREDGYREYGYERDPGNERAEGTAPRDLRRPVPLPG